MQPSQEMQTSPEAQHSPEAHPGQEGQEYSAKNPVQSSLTQKLILAYQQILDQPIPDALTRSQAQP